MECVIKWSGGNGVARCHNKKKKTTMESSAQCLLNHDMHKSNRSEGTCLSPTAAQTHGPPSLALAWYGAA